MGGGSSRTVVATLAPRARYVSVAATPRNRPRVAVSLRREFERRSASALTRPLVPQMGLRWRIPAYPASWGPRACARRPPCPPRGGCGRPGVPTFWDCSLARKPRFERSEWPPRPEPLAPRRTARSTRRAPPILDSAEDGDRMRRNTRGSRATIRMRAMAAPWGRRRPCSQFWSVSTLMPTARAKPSVFASVLRAPEEVAWMGHYPRPRPRVQELARLRLPTPV